MQRWLNDWVLQYVDGDPENSSESVKAQKPLAAAEVQVAEVRITRAITRRSSSCVRIIVEG